MNYYNLLNIDKNSTTTEIKKKYYKLAKKYHPDKNKNISDDLFKNLSEAYKILSNPKKRYIYDLKILLKENLGEEFINSFTDEELEILNEYYKKISNYTEFKFLKLIYNSLPSHVKYKFKFKTKFKTKIYSKSVLNLKNIKYIDATNLIHDYNIILKRNLKDVYLNSCKQIIIICNSKIYYLFITHSDYLINIYNNYKSNIQIKIETILTDKYTLNGHDLYYNHCINLYQYYYESCFKIYLPNESYINLNNTEEFNYLLKIPSMGIKKQNNIRGDLYIYKNIDLKIKNIENHKQIIYKIFTSF